MSKRNLYMDNAATSFPKAPGVERALSHFTSFIGASAGRGAYPRAIETGKIIYDTRVLLARLIGVEDPLNIIFTANASDGLNLAIHGMRLKAGDRVVVSSLEHNSVLRPLNRLKQEIGIAVDKIPCSRQGYIDLKKFKSSIKKKTKLIAVLHASNVLGIILPVKEIGRIAQQKGIPLLVDAAQSIGSIPLDVGDLGADMVAFPGHKSLLGPLGTGGLFIAPGVKLHTIKEGGTGSLSEQEIQPDFMPDRYEPGSHNALGIAGLKAAVEYIHATGVPRIRAHKKQLIQTFTAGLRRIPYLTMYGPRRVQDQIGVISLAIAGYTPQKLAGELFDKYTIMTRYGLHCAPGAHAAAGSFPQGSVRFSFSYFNTVADVEYALHALAAIARH